ncbi:MAG: 4a-hydroxytetrahydrobiopterin dehydratase [Nitrospirae bacterium]|nr:4a-hydroxytetrahydrobiopterin dehydratase [Nitrospirota bacterium]
MTPALTPADVRTGLEEVKDWKYRSNEITKSYKLSTFRKSIEFVNRIADHSESVDHHPDVTIRYTTVVISITTHSENGVTQKDLEWAKAADAIYREVLRIR